MILRAVAFPGSGVLSWYRVSPRTVVLAGVWSLFVARLAFVAVLLPPWQNPDEPPHYAIVRTLARQASLDLSKRGDPKVHHEILVSMAEHGWWEAYGEPTPNPVPATFGEGSPRHLGDEREGPILYYLAASRYCRFIGATSVLGQYYAVRVASLLMTLLTFGIILRAARESFGQDVALCTGALVALVPQFALIGIAVSPDPLVYLAGAFVWWQGVRIAAGKGVALAVAGMVAATAVAVLSKQLAFPLIAQTVFLAFAATAATRKTSRARATTLIATPALLLAGVAGVAVVLARPESGLLDRYVGWLGWQGQPFVPEYFFKFTWLTFESAFLAVGWQRFFPPPALVALAMVMCVFGIGRGASTSLLGADGRLRLGAFLAALFVAVQLWAIYGTKFYLPWEGAQGRFLFACIGPFAALCALGLVRWRSSATRAVVCCAVVALMAALDVVAWVTTLIPAYAP